MPKAKSGSSSKQLLNNSQAISQQSHKSQKKQRGSSKQSTNEVEVPSISKSSKTIKKDVKIENGSSKKVVHSSKSNSLEKSKGKSSISYEKINQIEQKEKVQTQEKSPVQPIKAISAYQIFSNKILNENKEKFQDSTGGEKFKIIGEIWSKLTEKKKGEYVLRAEEDKNRYTKQMKYFKKNGYFNNQEGQDSRNLKKLSKFKKTIKDNDQISEESDKKQPKSEEEFVAKPKKKNPDKNVCELSKILGQEWNKLTDTKKDSYQKYVDEDQKRFDKETKEFEKLGYFFNSDGVKSTMLTKSGKVLQFERGTVMPKAVMGQYMYFQSEQSALFKKNMKPGDTYDFGKVGKQIGVQWHALSSQKKKKYVRWQNQDKQRYIDQLVEIRQNGYFVTEDGIKSIDLPEKKKKIKKARKIKKID